MSDLPIEADEADALEQLETAGDAVTAVRDPQAAGDAATWTEPGPPPPDDKRAV